MVFGDAESISFRGFMRTSLFFILLFIFSPAILAKNFCTNDAIPDPDSLPSDYDRLDFSCAEVHNHSQVKPSFLCLNICDVTNP